MTKFKIGDKVELREGHLSGYAEILKLQYNRIYTISDVSRSYDMVQIKEAMIPFWISSGRFVLASKMNIESVFRYRFLEIDID